MIYKMKTLCCDPVRLRKFLERLIVSEVGRYGPALFVLLALCTAGGTWVSAQDTSTSVVRLPDGIVFTEHPGAPQHVTLFGDSSKPGLYVDRIKFPSGTKVMPHWHPDAVRTVLVLSGTFYFAVGEQWDESLLKPFPAGTLYSEPAKTPHYAWAKDDEVILQVTAIGPTGNTSVSRTIK
jgi:quercetin dioxygenase-like cupin family protein